MDVGLEVKQYGHPKVVLKSYGPNILKTEYLWLDGCDNNFSTKKTRDLGDTGLFLQFVGAFKGPKRHANEGLRTIQCPATSLKHRQNL